MLHHGGIIFNRIDNFNNHFSEFERTEAGKIDIRKLGSVVNPNGDAINAELASEDSNLGFTADSVVEGNIRFGKAADTLDLGNLKSFAGTIYMGGVSSADAYDTIKVGSKVRVTNPYDENGTHLAVSGTYDVIQVNGDRIVIGKGSAVTAAVPRKNLALA